MDQILKLLPAEVLSVLAQIAYVLPPAVVSACIQIVLALIAFLVARWMLKGLDKRTGFDFKRWISNAEDLPVSIYVSARILAVCHLLGLIVSGSL